jgi:hypothetical protein
MTNSNGCGVHMTELIMTELTLLDRAVDAIVGFFLGGGAALLWLRSYVAEKAKNQATLQDIGAITTETEHAKKPFSDSAEQLKHSNALRMASLDRRLAAHQEAFALWRKLLGNVFGDNTQAVVHECDQWWTDNCLYLEPGARSAFSQAYWAAQVHSALVQGSTRTPAEIADIQANFNLIKNAGDEIMRAVSLPELNPREERVEAEKDALGEDVPAAANPHFQRLVKRR